jgi:hypothetical protein
MDSVGAFLFVSGLLLAIIGGFVLAIYLFTRDKALLKVGRILALGGGGALAVGIACLAIWQATHPKEFAAQQAEYEAEERAKAKADQQAKREAEVASGEEKASDNGNKITEFTIDDGKTAIPSKWESIVMFDDSFIPKAEGKGNFEICLTGAAIVNEATSVHIPKNTIFKAWGPVTSPLTNKIIYYPITSDEEKKYNQYAVITTKPVLLTEQNPCIITIVNSLLNEGFGLSKSEIRVGSHMLFQANGLFKSKAGDIVNPTGIGTDMDSMALLNDMIQGTPVLDIFMSQNIDDHDPDVQERSFQRAMKQKNNYDKCLLTNTEFQCGREFSSKDQL